MAHLSFRGALIALFVATLGACGGSGDGEDSDGATSTNSSSAASSGSDTNGTSSGGTSSSSAGGATSNSSSVTDGSGGGDTSASASTGTGGSDGASTNGGTSCEDVMCLRPYECAKSCDSEPTYVGCCPCKEGMVDQFVDCDASAGCGGETCAANEYCAKPVGECDASSDLVGCALMPDACTLEYAPVCGCDGMTYGNSCGAASAGVSVATEGECQ